MHDVAQALSHLHNHNVLHRDLSSNNVLLIGNCRAKVTDFGMAKLLGIDPRLTPTYCPGTNVYMPPEALADKPSYDTPLDVFSFGVLLIQVITRKFPNPGRRTRTVEHSDPNLPMGTLLLVIPELERRKDHIDLVPSTHLLLELAMNCLKDKDVLRPTAKQLCSSLIALRETSAYKKSRDQEKIQQTQHPSSELIKKQEKKIEALTEEITHLERHCGHLTEDILSKDNTIRQKNAIINQTSQQIREKENEIQRQSVVIQRQENFIAQKQEELKQKDEQLQGQLQASSQENEFIVGALQKGLLQKDSILKSKDKQLQQKKRELQELKSMVPLNDNGEHKEELDLSKGQLTCAAVFGATDIRQRKKHQPDPMKPSQQNKKERKETKERKNLLKLEWSVGLKAPSTIHGESAVLSNGVVYFCEGVDDSNVITYNLETSKWAVFSKCPKKYFSIAVVNGQLTAVGGKEAEKDTKTLVSVTEEKGWLGTWQKWTELFPPMIHCHNNPAITTTQSHLIVAGGWSSAGKSSVVEAMNINSKSWFAVARLPYPVHQATVAHFQGQLYIGGGCTLSKTMSNQSSVWTKSVVTCQVHNLLKSNTYQYGRVWRQVTDLPLVRSSLVALQGQLLALGGSVSGGDSNLVFQYDATRNSWHEIGTMATTRRQFFAVSLSNNQLMVVGWTH